MPAVPLRILERVIVQYVHRISSKSSSCASVLRLTTRMRSFLPVGSRKPRRLDAFDTFLAAIKWSEQNLVSTDPAGGTETDVAIDASRSEAQFSDLRFYVFMRT